MGCGGGRLGDWFDCDRGRVASGRRAVIRKKNAAHCRRQRYSQAGRVDQRGIK